MLIHKFVLATFLGLMAEGLRVEGQGSGSRAEGRGTQTPVVFKNKYS